MSEEMHQDLIALKAIAAAMEAQTRVLTAQTDELKSIAAKVDDVQVRLIRVEEAKHGRDIERIYQSLEEIKGRLYILELANATIAGQFKGASFTLGWIYKIAPWLIPLLVAVYFFWEARVS